MSGRLPPRLCMTLRKKYGNIYSLYLGRRPAVVISGLKTIKEALVTKGSDFSGRPQDMFINDAIKTSGVIMQDYDNAWKEHRRFALMTLRNFGMGKNSMEDRINGEIEYIVNTLEKSDGKTLSPHLMFHNAASNIICQVLFGTRYEYDDHFIREIIRCFTENAKIANGPWAMVSQQLSSFNSYFSHNINYKCATRFIHFTRSHSFEKVFSYCVLMFQSCYGCVLSV
uniref:Cytochrome P450, family 2, subfamily X, polypeptide 9 n=1 Tax=Tetraodon nigroviridis TaxID=99883 RepID=H3C308_TETNG